MKFLLFIGLLLLSFYLVPAQEKYTLKVNSFIGTGAADGSPLSGNNYPGATIPFGMVQLSPDTRNVPDWSVACGYNFNDSTIAGFSHTHLSGTGVAELFDVMVTPFTGSVIKNTDQGNPYQSKFSHNNEKAHPGYYQVLLEDYNINAELTATPHSEFHCYNFPKGEKAHIMLDMDHSMKKSDWNTRIIASQNDIMKGGTLEFIMGNKPNTKWGINKL